MRVAMNINCRTEIVMASEAQQSRMSPHEIASHLGTRTDNQKSLG
jgi:hypothetical protein